jgi:hypothetical protein
MKNEEEKVKRQALRFSFFFGNGKTSKYTSISKILDSALSIYGNAQVFPVVFYKM